MASTTSRNLSLAWRRPAARLSSSAIFNEKGFMVGFGIQVIGVVAAFVWAFGVGYIAFKLIDLVIGLRVSESDELRGLDLSEHRMESYPEFPSLGRTS